MKRTAFAPRAPLRRDTGEARATVPVPRPRICKACLSPFQPLPGLLRPIVCSPKCGEAWARARREKAEAKAQLIERRADKAKRESTKTRKVLLAEAKLAVQRFRRLEELAKGSGCMSCKRSQAEAISTDGWKPGGAFDGGHYQGKGAYPELALEPRNIWLQCKSCNAGSGKYARKNRTVHDSFRDNLIEQEGLALVEWLESPHEPLHYTADDLRAIRDLYRAKARAL